MLDYGDHFTSNAFNNLYWTSFERQINEEQPSSECQPDWTHHIQENCWQANEEVDEIVDDIDHHEDADDDSQADDEVGVHVDHTGIWLKSHLSIWIIYSMVGSLID